MGIVKKSAALANAELGTVPTEITDAIVQAATEVIEGKWDDEFVLDVYQTGSGTSTNMNTNEVVAHRASQILGPDGPFARHLAGFAPRPQQQALADAVERALRDGGPLVGEAGTGVGKTFAYLVPAMLSGARVLISTGTRHLQDQLFHKDLPLVRRILGAAVDVAVVTPARELEPVVAPGGGFLRQLFERHVGPLAGEQGYRSSHVSCPLNGAPSPGTICCRWRRMRWASAGHGAPILYDPSTDKFPALGRGGLPLGLMAGVAYQERVVENLTPGTILLPCTDGVWETRNEKGEEWGLDRFQQLIRDSANESAAEISCRIRTAVEEWRGNSAQDDDITFVVVKLLDDSL